MKKAVIVLPTYNEIENIGRLLEAIQKQQQRIENVRLSVVVVDDSSPDGTGEFVRIYSITHKNVYLLNGTGKQGLGAAYVRGFKYAINNLRADIVFEMDADFSHNPDDIPRLLQEVLGTSDFAIGSRYIKGGSIPQDWPEIRKLNSKIGNLFARYVAGLQGINDCTSGFRAIRTPLLKKIDLDRLGAKGYAFQMNLLHSAIAENGVVTEIPIQFTDRTYGISKLSLQDIREFILNAFLIRFPFLKALPDFLRLFFLGFILGITLIALRAEHLSLPSLPILAISVFALLMSLQSLMTIYWMIYAWEDPERMQEDAPPYEYAAPNFSFTAIIPARHEEAVIADTLRAVANINYPENRKEVLVVCRHDDHKTIEAVNLAISTLDQKNIRLVTFTGYPVNKPHSLNIGLKKATKDIVVIFDAEDQPHRDIYNIANSILMRYPVDVIQSGVQLMNFRSPWFATLNVLEYFFWFKSALHMFANMGIVPLGGNTVFFRRTKLTQIGGWDERCLTEDADIGIRLSSHGARCRVVYSGTYVTREETPHTMESFIKQRSRWNQGFLQVLRKGDWNRLPSFSQKLLALYVLLLPELQAAFFVLLPVSVIMAFLLKLPVLVALISIIPFLLLVLQLLIYSVGLYEFTREYKERFTIWMPVKILITFYPYQLLLGISALRALARIVSGKRAWEKTIHLNAHRQKTDIRLAYTLQ